MPNCDDPVVSWMSDECNFLYFDFCYLVLKRPALAFLRAVPGRSSGLTVSSCALSVVVDGLVDATPCREFLAMRAALRDGGDGVTTVVMGTGLPVRGLPSTKPPDCVTWFEALDRSIVKVIYREPPKSPKLR